MTDEEILKNLGELARDEERERKSSPWTLLTEGELSEADVAALEAKAREDAEGARRARRTGRSTKRPASASRSACCR